MELPRRGTTEEIPPLTERKKGIILFRFSHPFIQFLTNASQTQQKTTDMVSWETDKGQPPSREQDEAMKWNVGMFENKKANSDINSVQKKMLKV